MNAHSDKDLKIPLPKFIQLFTSNGVSMPKAMAVAGKVYAKHNTPATLSQLSDTSLAALGVEGKDSRKLMLSSLQKAGYISKGTSRKALKTTPAAEVSLPAAPTQTSFASTGSSYIQTATSPRKRRRPVDSNEFLPDEPTEEVESASNFDFNEIVDEEILKTKSAVINRAPVMMAWAMLVAECLHFSREEALSIASVYTEMNAITKGASLGIYKQDRDRGSDAEIGGSQPYVELMGRRPLYRVHTGSWRALSNGKPVPPSDAFSYITRSFRQTTPYIIGALKLLAHSYSPGELKTQAWSLYADFRPQANEWGKRSQIHCQTIMALSKKTHNPTGPKSPIAKETEPNLQSNIFVRDDNCIDSEPQSKKSRHLTVEEYEALLDQDTTFNNVDLDFVNEQVHLQ